MKKKPEEITGADIRQFRQKAGLSQARLAEELQLSENTIQRMESKQILNLLFVIAIVWFLSQYNKGKAKPDRGDRRKAAREQKEFKVMTGSELREKRLALGLTQDALGRRLGVTWKTVNRWENGKANMELTLLVSIAVDKVEKDILQERSEKKAA